MKILKNEAIMNIMINTDEFFENYIIAHHLKFMKPYVIQRSASFDHSTHVITETYCIKKFFSCSHKILLIILKIRI